MFAGSESIDHGNGPKTFVMPPFRSPFFINSSFLLKQSFTI